MKRIFTLFYWLGMLTTLNCREIQFDDGIRHPAVAEAEYYSRVTTAAVETQSSDSMRTLLTYSADPAAMGQTVDFTCTTYNGSAFANSSSAILSAWLYTLVSGSQTQVAFGSAASTPYSQTIPCVTLASLSGRTVQCTFTATAIVFSLSNVLVSDEKKYGCQVFVSTNAAYSVSWTDSLRVYAPPQPPQVYFYPPNPISSNQNYLQSVTCAGNVGNPTHQISLFYQPAANPGEIYRITGDPSVQRKTNADGTINATYTYYLSQTACRYDLANNSYRSYRSYNSEGSCRQVGGYLDSRNNGDLYSCVISNNYSTISNYSTSTSEALDLQYQAQSPEVEVNADTSIAAYGYSYSYNISVNECISLSCSSSGNPAPTVLWIRVSSQANQSLAISKFTRNKYTAFAVATGSFKHADSLTFVCFVSNKIGTGSNLYTTVLYQSISIFVNSAETFGKHDNKSRNLCGQAEGIVDPGSQNGEISECSPQTATTVQSGKAPIKYTTETGDQSTQEFHSTSVDSQMRNDEIEYSSVQEKTFQSKGNFDELEKRPSSIVTTSATSTLPATSESTSSSAAISVVLSDNQANPGCNMFSTTLKPSQAFETLLRHVNVIALICVFISSSFLSGMIVFIAMKIKANKLQKLAHSEPVEKAAEIKTATIENEKRKKTETEEYENRLFFLDETAPIVKKIDD